MTPKRHATFHTSYEDRAALPYTSPLQIYLLHLIALKKTNLCVSADVSTTAELLSVAEEVGDSICILKTHADIIDDWGDRTVRGLREVAKRKRFLIFEDRKFGDIGSKFRSFCYIVLQLRCAIARREEWPNLGSLSTHSHHCEAYLGILKYS